MNIDKHINSILNGTEDLPKFNQPEHAGVCSAGPLLVGASSYVISPEKAFRQVEMLEMAKRLQQTGK